MPRGNVPLIFRPADRTAGDAPPVRPGGGSLRVVTNNLRPGYLRKNGIPYSENAVLTEHWDLYKRPNGEEWLTITHADRRSPEPSQREADRAGVQEGAERRQVGSDALLVAVVTVFRKGEAVRRIGLAAFIVAVMLPAAPAFAQVDLDRHVGPQLAIGQRRLPLFRTICWAFR